MRSAREAYGHHSGVRARIESSLLQSLFGGSFSFLLNRMDKDAMSHSVETRLPFLDREMLGLVLNLPLEERVGPTVKGLLREVARRHLPAEIVARPKQAGMVFNSLRRIEQAARPGFLEHGHLRELLEEPAERWQRRLRRKNGRMRLWTAEIWCRLVVDGQAISAVERDLWIPERFAEPAPRGG
jgi:asparagine synthetase B (glutamine-hydrolysing)